MGNMMKLIIAILIAGILSTASAQKTENKDVDGHGITPLVDVTAVKDEFRNKKSEDDTDIKSNQWKIPVLNMEFVYVQEGTFQMGLKNGKDNVLHTVRLTKPFWIGKYEVTQKQWVSLKGENPSYNKGEDLPVELVNWYDAVSFCEKLTEQERKAGRLKSGLVYRLPTEAEWEYACRGGSSSKGFIYSGSNNVDDVAWYDKNGDIVTQPSGYRLHPVGQKKPNELGIYDMSGNQWEWCYDWYDNYPDIDVADPVGPSSGKRRVARGGRWNADSSGCVSTCRVWRYPDYSGEGFRIVMGHPLHSDKGEGKNLLDVENRNKISSDIRIKGYKTADANASGAEGKNDSGPVEDKIKLDKIVFETVNLKVDEGGKEVEYPLPTLQSFFNVKYDIFFYIRPQGKNVFWKDKERAIVRKLSDQSLRISLDTGLGTKPQIFVFDMKADENSISIKLVESPSNNAGGAQLCLEFAKKHIIIINREDINWSSGPSHGFGFPVDNNNKMQPGQEAVYTFRELSSVDKLNKIVKQVKEDK